jgi:large subunit ribosomal protein L18
MKEKKIKIALLSGSADETFAIASNIGKKLKEGKIGSICFDRNGLKYHGRVKALADGARAAGLSF